jgi:hypothetical protein
MLCSNAHSQSQSTEKAARNSNGRLKTILYI